MNLHGEIMNIECNPLSRPFDSQIEKLAYRIGHKDARHAAAELALKYDAIAASHRRLVEAVNCIRVFHMVKATKGSALENDTYGEFIKSINEAEALIKKDEP